MFDSRIFSVRKVFQKKLIYSRYRNMYFGTVHFGIFV